MADEWDPELYGKFKDQRSEAFHDLVALIEPRSNAEVVDLGCGTGELTRLLKQRLKARKVLGLDASVSMLKKAESLAIPGELEFQPDALGCRN